MVRDKPFTSDSCKESKEQKSLILFISLGFTHGKVSHIVEKLITKNITGDKWPKEQKKATASRVNHVYKHV